MANKTVTALRCAAAIVVCLTAGATSLVAQDGPDFYRVTGVASDDTLNIRAEPRADSEKLGEIPPDTDCLRNLGCQGGLSFEEFSNLSKAQQEQRLKENPRWCKIEYQGTTGWVAGRFLQEGSCGAQTRPAASAAPVAPEVDEAAAKRLLTPDETLVTVDLPVIGETTVKGVIEGYKTPVYAIALVERQRLTVRMETQSPSAYFNVIDVRDQSGAAVFRGEVDGASAQIDAKAATTYLIRPFLVPAVARRGSRAEITLTIKRE